MKLSVDLPDFRKFVVDAEAAVGKQLTAAMRDVVKGMKDDLREQVRRAGMGNKLAYTWQGDAYPKSGKSLSPSAYVFSKAPRIVGAHARAIAGGSRRLGSRTAGTKVNMWIISTFRPCASRPAVARRHPRLFFAWMTLTKPRMLPRLRISVSS